MSGSAPEGSLVSVPSSRGSCTGRNLASILTTWVSEHFQRIFLLSSPTLFFPPRRGFRTSGRCSEEQVERKEVKEVLRGWFSSVKGRFLSHPSVESKMEVRWHSWTASPFFSELALHATVLFFKLRYNWQNIVLVSAVQHNDSRSYPFCLCPPPICALGLWVQFCFLGFDEIIEYL